MIFKIALTIFLFLIGLIQVITASPEKLIKIKYFKGKEKNVIITLLCLILIVSIGIDIKDYRDNLETKLANKNLTNKVEELKKNTDIVKKIASNTLRSGFFIKAFDRKVSNIELRLNLDTIYESKDVGKIMLAFEFSNVGPENLNYNFYAENSYKNNPLNSLFGTNIKKDSLIHVLIFGGLEGHEKLNPLGKGNLNPKVSHITFPLISIMKSEHSKINDWNIGSLNGTYLKLYIEENTLKKLYSVQLIVNGWAILDQKINSDEWQIKGMSDALDWMNNLTWSEQVGMYHRMELYRGGKTFPAYKINLYNTIPHYYSEKDKN